MKDPDHGRPRSGWTNSEVEALVKGSTFTTSTNTPTNTRDPTSSDPARAKPSPRSHQGAIAGGVVGGLLAILAGVVWFFYFRPDGAHVRPGLPVDDMTGPGYGEMHQPDMQANPYTLDQAYIMSSSGS